MNTSSAECSICEGIFKCLYNHPRNWPFSPSFVWSAVDILGPSQHCELHQRFISSIIKNGIRSSNSRKHGISLRDIQQISLTYDGQIGGIVLKIELEDVEPPILEFVLHSMREPDDNRVFIGGRIFCEEWIDSDLPRLWKNKCDQYHTGICQRFPGDQVHRSMPRWLVDVDGQYIVEARDECSYVALSYVWGKSTSTNATTGNLNQLRKPGALRSVPLARTIRDAIGVTKLLEERYLWVDALCIVQDDYTQKHIELAKMGGIYANSTVTIVAADGEDADFGLRGYREFSAPRSHKQQVHWLGNTKIVYCPAEKLGFRSNGAPATSVWSTRGWCYQEHLFSRRRLIFEHGLVRWQCAYALWHEYSEAFPNDWGLCQQQSFNLYDYLFESMLPTLGNLQTILQQYNRRAFTYPEDVFRAFEGIAYAASPAFGGGFVSGLPTAYFDAALLWFPVNLSISRRVARRPEKSHCLPSWSWAGWTCDVDFMFHSGRDYLKPNPYHVCPARFLPDLEWFYHDLPASPGRRVHRSTLIDRNAPLLSRGEYEALGWTKVAEDGDVRAEAPDPRLSKDHFYRHEDYNERFWYPIPLTQRMKPVPSILTSYISCTTRRAWLTLDQDNWSGERTEQPYLSLSNSKGIWAGLLRPDNLEGNFSSKDPAPAVELVHIAKGSYCNCNCRFPKHKFPDQAHPETPDEGLWHDFYWVMWIGWVDGIAYRKGLGRVPIEIWEQERGEPFRLMLG